MASRRKTDATETLKQLTYLASALKAPRITEAPARLADHARDAGWTHEEYFAAVLDREVTARNATQPRNRHHAQHQDPRQARLELNEPVTSFSSVGSAPISSVADAWEAMIDHLRHERRQVNDRRMV